MSQSIRTSLVALGLAAALTGGAWIVQAKEPHPVLQNSKRQLEAIKDRLQKAPTDFAVDAIGHAISELDQAIQYDSK